MACRNGGSLKRKRHAGQRGGRQLTRSWRLCGARGRRPPAQQCSWACIRTSRLRRPGSRAVSARSSLLSRTANLRRHAPGILMCLGYGAVPLAFTALAHINASLTLDHMPSSRSTGCSGCVSARRGGTESQVLCRAQAWPDYGMSWCAVARGRQAERWHGSSLSC